MATYVNNLRLKEIVTGAESGTWGTSTNTNLELIADALGSGTEAITTNADTHTTTIADGAADEGRALFLKYTGTLDSACTITLAPNTVNKLWFIENATSGSQNIIISQGSGANITIAPGKISVILTDGAGSGAAVLDALADLELSSTLSVAGASTLTGVTTHGGNVVSDADSTDDLGTTGVRWANLWVDAITLGGTLAGAVATFSSTVGITGVTTHGGNVVSDADSTDDLGTTSVRWANLWVDAITMGGTLAGAAATFSSTLAVTGDATVTADIILGTNNTSVLTGINTSGAEVNLIYLDNADNVSLASAGNQVNVGGSVFINDGANAKMTTGITINQGAADNEILTLKSSDVNHPMTAETEADTYGYFKKHTHDSGGLSIAGVKGSVGDAEGALALTGMLGQTADTTKSTTAGGVINMASVVTNGSTGVTVVGTDGNLVVMHNGGSARFIFDAEGSGHADVEWTTFSDSRLKKNIETIPYGLDTVRDLDARIFDKHSGYIDDDGNVVLEDGSRRMIGFIAQEVQPLVPELVKDVDDKSFYSLDVGRFTPILWSAVKELDTTVQEYQARIEALEAALTELQGA